MDGPPAAAGPPAPDDMEGAPPVEGAERLAPTEAVAAARPALLAAMTAFADSVAPYGPAELPLTFDWPARRER